MRKRLLVLVLGVGLALGLVAQPGMAAPVTITPGAVWNDTSGHAIQAHGEGITKVGGTYYLFGSHLTGWSTNDNQYATATSITGTWSAWHSFAPSGTNTCNSQTTSILPVSGSGTTSYAFLGDRWNSGNLADSRYVWDPLSISGTTVTMTCRTSWTIDTATGSHT
jgi:hypothetical protein